MKTVLSIKNLAAVLLLGSTVASRALLAVQTYEFQWQTSDATFQPTFLWVTAALNVATPTSSSILNYDVTTPTGVWTPTALTGAGASASTPFWSAGSVEVINGGANLVFLSSGLLEAYSSGPATSSSVSSYYYVGMTTTNVFGTAFQTVAPSATIPSSGGAWVAVPAVSSVPESTSTIVLLTSALAGLAFWHARQNRVLNS